MPPRRTCRIPHALLHPDVLPKSRLAPVSAVSAHITAHGLHASDHTRPNRATVLGSRISRRRSPPGDVSYRLEDSSHSLHLVGLASSNSPPICPRHRRPSGGSNRPPPHGLVSAPFDKRWSPYRPIFTATLARTISPIPGHQRYLPVSFSVYPPAYPRQRQLFRLPQPQRTLGLSLPTQLFSYFPVNRIQTPNGSSAFLDDTTTYDLLNHGSPALARRCFRIHRLSHIHLGSPPRRYIPQWIIFFLSVRVFLVQPSIDSVSVDREHRIVPLQPNGRESPSVPEDTSATPIPPPPFCLNNPVGLPPEPRQPLPVPEGTSVTPLSPPPLP